MKLYRKMFDIRLHKKTFDKTKNIKNIKARAEEYTAEELDAIKHMNKHVFSIITNYVYPDPEEKTQFYTIYKEPENKNKKLLFIVGPRGIGKTFTMLKVMRSIVVNRKEIPEIYIFKMNNRLELLNKEAIATEKDTAECKKSDIIVYDDIHYLCEAIINGTEKKEVLINTLRQILKDATTGKKVIVFSDATINWYAEKINDEVLFDLMPAFGDFSVLYSKDNIETIQKQRARVDYLVKMEYPKVSNSEIMDIAEDVGAKIDTETWWFIMQNKLTPRGIINFIKLMNTDKITYNYVLQMAIKIIDNNKKIIKDPYQKMAFLKLKKIPMADARRLDRDMKVALRSLRSFNDLERYINIFEEKKALMNQTIDDEINRIETLNKGYPWLKDSMTGIKEITNYWDKMESYYIACLNLKRLKSQYVGDTSLFLGWKGNLFSLYQKLKDVDKDTRDIMLKALPDMIEINRTEYPFPILDKVYQECFQEGGYVNEMIDYINKEEKNEKRI